MLQQESLYFSHHNHNLHIRHIHKDANGVPVLMLHGAIENGRIFYTDSGKGLASYLAEQGYDVYVADYRGRGLSTPSIKENQAHGQHETITQDIPELIKHIHQLTNKKLHLICHSWGGVMAASSIARFPELANIIMSKVCFGTKRQISVWNMERLLKVTLVWNRLSPVIAKYKGYLDAKRFGFGSDNETYHSLMQSVNWVKKGPWKDSIDGFDYYQAAKSTKWPATWHLTGVKDHVLGHAQDVQAFIQESNKQSKFSLLSKDDGNALDYDHINILTHPSAVTDHFPEVVLWLKKHQLN